MMGVRLGASDVSATAMSLRRSSKAAEKLNAACALKLQKYHHGISVRRITRVSAWTATEDPNTNMARLSSNSAAKCRRPR